MITVASIDDHPLYRSGLVDVIDRAGDLRLVASAGSVEEFAQRSPERCDVLLLDLGLPGISGPSAVAAVSPWTAAVLILSGSEALGWMADAITAGARGCVTKQAQEAEILDAIRAVASGHTYITPAVASYILKGTVVLTPRQREILTSVADGDSDQDIADKLNITVSAVHGHLDRIGEKTGCRKRGALIKLAEELGIRRRPQLG